MPAERHRMEAARILTRIGADRANSQTRAQSRQVLAEALEKAEQQGRQGLGQEKESSG
jgi:mannose/cellobiose epimerase-like protein (N-acyl-D-glucosamine 2-epimerase family)